MSGAARLERRGPLAALLISVVVASGCSASPSVTPTPIPSPTPTISCQVAIQPQSIQVEPETGDSGDVLYLAGTGFPPNVAVTLDMAPVGSVMDFTTDASGSFSRTIEAEPGVTHLAAPSVEAGPVTWTITAGECEAKVTFTVEFTHQPSEAPPTDLSAGDYAEVVADGVRVRAGPSPTATVVGALFSGDVVKILAPAQVAEGYAWYLVQTVVVQGGQPLRGYVAAGSGTQAFLRRTTEPPPPTPTPLPSPSPSPS